ncbi:MAG: TlyA family rRNA (cytidine-2'-O)-methyltransferase [Phycisphaera sp.]|nr:TlyA family rRNA (cytidine-2'-O)-methyltransferase [Phycisphaera sp.]
MSEPCPYVSHGGLKLAAALDAFDIDVNGRVCADLGANVGGFTDCLLQRGAAHVYSVDTAYGQFDWKLRNDERVTVIERTNALHFDPHSIEGFDSHRPTLVVIDLGWTRQQLAIPAALRWLVDTRGDATIVTLIKPHYEADRSQLTRGKLSDEDAQVVCDRVIAEIPNVVGCIESPIRGGSSRGGRGNREFLACLRLATC